MKTNTLKFAIIMLCLSNFLYGEKNRFSCTVNLDAVLIYASGAVNVRHDGRSDYTIVCSLKSEREGVDVQTCAMWAGMLLKMKQENLKTNFYYSTDKATSCSDLPTYSASPAPVYIGDTN